MSITYVKGDLFDTKIKCIAHGCNAQGRMGKGVALGVKKLFPKAFNDYHAEYVKHGLEPGDFVRVVCGDKIIYNLITQKDYARAYHDPWRYLSYDALANVFTKLNKEKDILAGGLAIPKIGSDLGGGDWEIIKTIILRSAPNLTVTCYVLK